MKEKQFKVYCRICSREMATADIKTVGDIAIVEKILEETNLAIAIYICSCEEKTYLLVRKGKKKELNAEKNYHIFTSIDCEIDEKLNMSRADVDSYLSECSISEINHKRVKIFFSHEKLKIVTPKVFVKLSD